MRRYIKIVSTIMLCLLIMGSCGSPFCAAECAAREHAVIGAGNGADSVERLISLEIDYSKEMMSCCLSGDITAGKEAERKRNEKIDTYHIDAPKISFDELNELSKIITSEAGSSWLPMDWKMKIGEIVMNRVASPEFPDTLSEVIHQPGQYAKSNTDWFENLIPYEGCVEAAFGLLSGERLLNDISVVFQSSKKQGGGVHTRLYDSYYGYTYLCFSSYPELYD